MLSTPIITIIASNSDIYNIVETHPKKITSRQPITPNQ